jgi:acetyl esterase/lipase
MYHLLVQYQASSFAPCSIDAGNGPGRVLLIATANDLRYAQRSPRNVLDLAVPQSATRPPLVVYIHGGAFRFGDKSDGLRERNFLVDAGFAVASVNYRYSTEAIWPAQLDDLTDAFAFLRGKADEFHFNGGRVASFGPSAGGHLSATCGIAFAESPETRLTASVVWYPPVDFTAMDSDIDATGVARATGRNDLPGSPESILIGATVADHPDLARAAGPIAALETLPPGALLPSFLIMHGARDPFIAAEQSRRLQRALASFGGSARLELDVLPNGTHGGGDFERPETMARVVSFLEDCFQRRNRDYPTE